MSIAICDDLHFYGTHFKRLKKYVELPLFTILLNYHDFQFNYKVIKHYLNTFLA